MKKIAIIGGGVGGLAAAARLAKTGNHVTIFEASKSFGGACQTISTQDFSFDLGPTSLTLPAVFRDLFIRTGNRLEKNVTLKQSEVAVTYHFSDGIELEFANLSLPAVLAEIERKLGSPARAAWQHLMLNSEAMWDALRPPFVESELPSKRKLLTGAIHPRDLLALAPFQSVASFLERRAIDPKLQAIAERSTAHLASNPRRTPAAALSALFVEQTFGIWRAVGGMGALSSALINRCHEVQVALRPETKISRLQQLPNQGWQLWLNDGTSEIFDALICNIDPEHFATNYLPKQSQRKILGNWRKVDRGSQIFSLQIGLDDAGKQGGKNMTLRGHHIFFSSDPLAETRGRFDNAELCPAPTIYLFASGGEEFGSMPGLTNLHIRVDVPRSNREFWTLEREGEYAQLIIDRLDNLGLQISARRRHQSIASPRTMGLAPIAMHGRLAPFARARTRSPLANLYFVGEGAHPGRGLPMVGMGAELAANAIDYPDGIPGRGHH